MVRRRNPLRSQNYPAVSCAFSSLPNSLKFRDYLSKNPRRSILRACRAYFRIVLRARFVSPFLWRGCLGNALSPLLFLIFGFLDVSSFVSNPLGALRPLPHVGFAFGQRKARQRCSTQQRSCLCARAVRGAGAHSRELVARQGH